MLYINQILLILFWVFCIKKTQAQGLFNVKINPNTNNIPVFRFQVDGYTSDTSWAFFNGTIPADLISFTFCHRFQILFTRPRMYLFTYAFGNKDANELYSAFRGCKRNTKYCAWHNDMPDFYQWRHICLAYDGYKDLYKLFVDGIKITSGSWTGDKSLEPVRKGGKLFLGQDQDTLGGGFQPRQSWSGAITQFNIWDVALEDYFVENAAECRSDLLGNVQEWNREVWITSNIEVSSVPLFELCGKPENINDQYFLFPLLYDYWFYKDWCYNQGGFLAVPNTTEKYHEMMDIASEIMKPDIHEKCLHASGSLIIWAGPTDYMEEDMWTNPYTKKKVDASFWEVGQPNGGEGENCVRTYVDRKWNDEPCDQLNCALCHFPVRMNLSMRGLCISETKLMEGYFDQYYFLQGFLNNKPHWRGFGKSHIYFIPRTYSWRIESYYDTEKYAEFAASDEDPYQYFPTGRSDWVINEGICAMKKGTEYKMTLTNCMYNDGSGYDFTCTDGTCVNMDKRCNLVADCPDGSDEKDCDILEIPQDYRSELFPLTEDGSPLVVKMNVTILSFPDISTLQLSYMADFVLLMTWSDPRLEFLNLVDSTDLNSLSLRLQQAIWVPKLNFPNARQAEGTTVDALSSTKILKKGVPIPDNTQLAVEARIYRGVDSPIIMKREYLISFTCDFDLHMYPFDTQICQIIMEVNGVPNKYLKLEVEIPEGCADCDGAEYTGNKLMVEYVVGDTIMDPKTNQTDKFGKVEVNIVFKRRWIYHLITVFLQSILLIGIAFLTFFFKISNFQDRMMISITTMMIVATIQSSIDKMVPKTSYLKMIDVWLLYSFNIIIVIMGIHTFMDTFIKRHPVSFSPINPRYHKKKFTDVEPDIFTVSDNINLWGRNPGWDPGFIRAYTLNYLGQVIRGQTLNYLEQMFNIAVFLLFNLIFWGFALSHYYSQVNLEKAEEKN
ncbi:uncharacterized protein LOC111708162 isoform X2 [Eurytemora carolleeae]|uniref:uncharacterized protein LOC111708162 isoform X2 n=1 Tax=Eurytemora carolleeae TaxID=1294199 RepID=UPI000C7831A1|nr:uncharacterized protein LOC111708162 isoform X2 [Eurytemora carolleeae]|eukprot:XP_023337222.1 uncharacterized protein LOC111708162 isoform X2 [Eurytemora affinis]